MSHASGFALLVPMVLLSAGMPHPALAAEPVQVAAGDAEPRPALRLEDLLPRLDLEGWTPGPRVDSPPTADGPRRLSAEWYGGYLTPWTPLTPTPRSQFMAAFDDTRGCLVMTGGSMERGYPDDAFELIPGHAWKRVAMAGLPDPRSGGAIAFDPAADRMLLFGGFRSDPVDGPPGYHCSSRNDTWELAAGADWRKIDVPGTRPPPRYGHTAVVDTRLNRLVVFGGTSLPPPAIYCWSTTPLNDVWVLPLSGTSGWSELHPVGSPPPAGIAGSAVFDASEDRLLFVAGSSVWSLRFLPVPAWESLEATGSGPTAPLSVVLDEFRRRLVVQDRKDTWSLDLTGGSAAWQRRLTADVPSFSEGFHAVLDAAHDRLLAVDATPVVRVWQLPLTDPGVWTDANSAPGVGMSAHRAVYDGVEDRMLALGGTDRPDVFAFDLASPGAWSVLLHGTGSTNEPGARVGHLMFHDPRRHRLVVFGGKRPDGGPEATTWSLDLGTGAGWVAHAAPPDSPPLATALTGSMDTIHDRILVIRSNEVWELPLANLGGWRLFAAPVTGPGTRHLATSTYDPVRNLLVLVGGFGAGADVSPWTFDPDGLIWEKQLAQGWFANAIAPVLVYDAQRDRYVLSTGLTYLAALSYSIPYRYWDYLDQHCCGWDTFTPPDRMFHAAIYDPVRDALVVSGGAPALSGGLLEDVWSLPFGSPGLRVGLILKPGQGASSRLGSNGVLPVAILGAPNFDATRVDPATVRVSGAAVRSPGEGHVRVSDVDGDGDLDLLLDLEARDLDLAEGQRVLLLTARMTSGVLVSGATILSPASLRGAKPAVAMEPADARFGIDRCSFGGPSLRVDYSVPSFGTVFVDVFDVAGRRRATARILPAAIGPNSALVGMSGAVTAGIYFVRIRQDARVETARSVIVSSSTP